MRSTAPERSGRPGASRVVPRSRRALVAALLLVAASAPALPAEGADRGRALYETRCGACHDRSVHRRESRLATDFATLRSEVARWNRNAGAEWRDEEIDLVTVYLNERFYKFPCPPSICREPARAESARRAF